MSCTKKDKKKNIGGLLVLSPGSGVVLGQSFVRLVRARGDVVLFMSIQQYEDAFVLQQTTFVSPRGATCSFRTATTRRVRAPRGVATVVDRALRRGRRTYPVDDV